MKIRLFRSAGLVIIFHLALSLKAQEESHSSSSLSSSSSLGEATNSKCGIYLAPSSIPGSGLGMYVGDKRVQKGDIVTLGDIVIPIFEMEWHNQGSGLKYPFLWNDYLWHSDAFPPMSFGQEVEWNNEMLTAASPGVGSVANSYLSLVNVDDMLIQVGRPVPWNSPGTGASSLYYGRSYYAKKNIPVGGEIFVSYGVGYFSNKPQTYGYLPLPRTYPITDELVTKYLAIKEEYSLRRPALDASYEIGADDGVWKDTYSMLLDIADVWKKSRILNGLPEDEESILRTLELGSTSQQHYDRSIREISWLEEHGQCMDNIKVGNSTNPDAGRGAFANRFIPKGGLVAPAPLIHIPNATVLKMFPSKLDPRHSGKLIPDRDGPFTFQLLLNYCFGHPKSTLLLCPYGLWTAFINHSAENPNTKIQWSKEGIMRHPEWLGEPIDEFAHVDHAGLSFDFVALRDIEENEEILIDYGAAWESAWQEHARNFVPRKNYIPAFERNEMDFPIIEDDDNLSQMDGVETLCRGFYLSRISDNNWLDSECKILKRIGVDRYIVEAFLIQYVTVEGVTTEIRNKLIFWDIPTDGIYFRDIPYQRDHHHKGAFRFPMIIPDNIFPERWKNIDKAIFLKN